MRFADRLNNLPPYVFAGIAKRIADMRASGIEVINLTMGDPDVPTPDFLLDELCEAVRRQENSRYPDYFGKKKFREAVADWYRNRFDVQLEPTSEVLALIGSKEGIANVALAFVDPGEAALVPDPSYPVYKYGTLMADGVSCPLKLEAENGWLPDLDSLDDDLCRDVNVLWLNYPNNPTGAVASLEFFERVVAWAKRHDVIVAHDNPYSEITFDGYVAPSILQVPGAKDIAIEFNSVSKTYSMAGQRLGMVVGNADVVTALGRIKSNIDSGVYGAIQDVAAVALTGDQSWIPARNEIYRNRRDKLCAAFAARGIEIEPPKGSLYLWGRVPEGYTSAQFAEKMLGEVAVAITAGTAYGAQGEGWFRVSLTVTDREVDEAINRLPKLQL